MSKKRLFQKPWQEMKIVITVQGDDEGQVFDVNVSAYPHLSWSYDYDSLPTLKELINEIAEYF